MSPTAHHVLRPGNVDGRGSAAGEYAAGATLGASTVRGCGTEDGAESGAEVGSSLLGRIEFTDVRFRYPMREDIEVGACTDIPSNDSLRLIYLIYSM